LEADPGIQALSGAAELDSQTKNPVDLAGSAGFVFDR
jgi:hypothetical protein